jgi:hypothetical protein
MEVLNERPPIFGKFSIILLKISFLVWKVLNKESYNVMKTLPHVFLTSFMRSKGKRNDLLCQGDVCGGGYFGSRDIHRCMNLVPLLEMEAHPLKDVEKAVIYLYVMLSTLRLIS